MSSYAPLLAKDGRTQWNPDLIYFNNREVRPTTGYYVQKLYGQNAGDHYIPSQINLDNQDGRVKLRVGSSIVRDSKTGDVIVKLVNLFTKKKINPLIGATGLSAVPMASRVANDIALKYDPKNHVLQYCMASNISGVIGSAVAAGVLISFLS